MSPDVYIVYIHHARADSDSYPGTLKRNTFAARYFETSRHNIFKRRIYIYPNLCVAALKVADAYICTSLASCSPNK